MNTCIALFRGINVGGKNKLPMKALTELLSGMGCENVKTYIQSGNAVFQIPETPDTGLADNIAKQVLATHDFQPKVLLLSATDLTQAIANNPFPTDEGKVLHFFFIGESPSTPDLAKLTALQTPTESFELLGRVFYLHAPEGVGRSKLFANIEKSLGVPTTARNWNTVAKLSELLEEY